MLAFMGLFYMRLVHRNARMTEMKRSGIEVVLVFADNVKAPKLQKPRKMASGVFLCPEVRCDLTWFDTI